MQTAVIPAEVIQNKIFIIRGQKVMLDRDLAELYGVPTKALIQATKRNKQRFPKDFMFQLTQMEKIEVVTICDHLKVLKFSSRRPFAFTEHGALMLANVLKSERAIKASIYIIRTFIKLREYVTTYKVLEQALKELEGRVDYHDKHIKAIFEAIRKLMEPAP